MRFSPRFPSSPHCLPSPDGRRIATLHLPTLTVRAVQGLGIVKAVKLPPDCSTGAVLTLQWSPSSRLLVVACPSDPILVVSAEDRAGEDSGGTGRGARPRGTKASTSTSTTGLVATIRNPTPPGTKLAYVCFGASDHELLAFSSLGLRLSLFNVATSTSVEIHNPKLFSATTASRGFSLRPRSGHLALLTRTAGKDYISLYEWPSRQLLRAWLPDTIDAQGLAFSPDGKWLVVWESPAYGVKVIFFTPDGHTFKTWTASSRDGGGGGGGTSSAVPEMESAAAPLSSEDHDHDHGLGPGTKILRFSADSSLLAAGVDSTVHLLRMTSVTEAMRMRHPITTVVPSDTCQVWSQTGPTTFLRATQPLTPVSPPPALPTSRPAGGSGGTNGVDSSGAVTGEAPKAGCASLDWGPSSALLASRLEELPGTVYIWDTAVSELRAVLLFQVSVSSLSWHPHVPETLLVRCGDDQYGGLAFVWDPLSEGPRPVEFTAHLKTKEVKTAATASSGTCTNNAGTGFGSNSSSSGGGGGGGKLRVSWLSLDPSISCAPSLWLSNAQSWLVASLTELGGHEGAMPVVWTKRLGPKSGGGTGSDGDGDGDGSNASGLGSGGQTARRAESPLELGLVGEGAAGPDDSDFLAMLGDEDDGESELEDTFIHKR